MRYLARLLKGKSLIGPHITVSKPLLVRKGHYSTSSLYVPETNQASSKSATLPQKHIMIDEPDAGDLERTKDDSNVDFGFINEKAIWTKTLTAHSPKTRNFKLKHDPISRIQSKNHLPARNGLPVKEKGDEQR